MAAGVIHGWLLGTLEKGLRYGVAMAALAHAQQGDILVATQDEIESVLDSDPTYIRR